MACGQLHIRKSGRLDNKREREREKNIETDKAEVMWAACRPTRLKGHSAEGFN